MLSMDTYIADAESGQYFFQGLFRCIFGEYRLSCEAHFVIAAAFFSRVQMRRSCCQLGKYIDIGSGSFMYPVDGAFLVIVINHMVDGAQSGFVFQHTWSRVKVAGDLYKTFLELPYYRLRKGHSRFPRPHLSLVLL